MQSERDRLFEELYKDKYWMTSYEGCKKLSIKDVVDFIVEDRKRIINPLILLLREGYLDGRKNEKGKYQIAIEETIKNAGIGE